MLMFDTLSSHPQKITESREEKVKSNQKLRKEKVEILLTKDRLQADRKAVLAPTAALFVLASKVSQKSFEISKMLERNNSMHCIKMRWTIPTSPEILVCSNTEIWLDNVGTQQCSKTKNTTTQII